MRVAVITVLLVCLWVGSAVLPVFHTVNAQKQAGPTAASAMKAAALRAAMPTKFAPTPERLKRGRYLVEGPAHCTMCHSQLDFSKRWMAPKPNARGAGGPFEEESLPFQLFVPNITPDLETGSGTWTDEQFERALRQGIGYDGRTLFPMMPYYNFRHLSDEDLASIVVYIRSLKPIRKAVPKTQLPPPIAAGLKPLPPVAGPVPGPDPNDPLKRGEYLVRVVGNCSGCHDTTDPQMNPIPGMEFAGGFTLVGPWGRASAANITPDPSGISYYDEALFIQMIRTGHVRARKLSKVMPTSFFRHMSDRDLKDIFAYLRTLKPVQHRVDNAEPPSYCKVCRGKHGAGERN